MASSLLTLRPQVSLTVASICSGLSSQDGRTLVGPPLSLRPLSPLDVLHAISSARRASVDRELKDLRMMTSTGGSDLLQKIEIQMTGRRRRFAAGGRRDPICQPGSEA